MSHPRVANFELDSQTTRRCSTRRARRGGRWGLHVLCFHMYEAPPGTPGRPRKSRLKAEALLSNAAYLCAKTLSLLHPPSPAFRLSAPLPRPPARLITCLPRGGREQSGKQNAQTLLQPIFQSLCCSTVAPKMHHKCARRSRRGRLVYVWRIYGRCLEFLSPFVGCVSFVWLCISCA